MSFIKLTSLLIITIVFVQKSFSQNLSENLLLNYNFESDYLDESINGFHGINVQTEFTLDRFGDNSAIVFNGNSCIETPNETVLKPDFPFSIACWIYPQVEFIRAEGIWGNDQFLDNYYGGFVSILSNGKIMASYGDGCGSTSPECRRSYVTESAMENNKWYHIGVNFIDEFTTAIYINGCLAPSTFSGSGNISIAYSNESGAIGKNDHSDNPSNPIGFYHGRIDDFYFWNRTINKDDLEVLIEDYFDANEVLITYSGCHNDGYEIEINNVLYNEENSNGVEVIPSLTGCDSILIIDLDFYSSISETIEYSGCIGDGYEVVVNSIVYNEDNPVGQEILLSSYGCDSIVKINLKFLEDQCSYFVPNIFSCNSSQPNNSFSIHYSDTCVPEELETRIFDRWGNLVFYSDKLDFKWTGHFNNQSVVSGVYTYLILGKNQKEYFTLEGDILFVK